MVTKDPLVVEKVFQPRVIEWRLVGIAATAIDTKFSNSMVQELPFLQDYELAG